MCGSGTEASLSLGRAGQNLHVLPRMNCLRFAYVTTVGRVQLLARAPCFRFGTATPLCHPPARLIRAQHLRSF
jgi:hypothetical protein